MIINLCIAFLIDLVVGDPIFRWHPIRLMGNMLKTLESPLYKLKNRIVGGLILVFIAVLTVFLITVILEYLKKFLYLPFSINILTIVLIYFLMCNRDMIKEARKVYNHLINDDLKSARLQVGRIVGRDTENLDRRAIIRATVETLAENIVDGFTSPLFFLLIGGIPLAYVYKTVNTIDSMFGYRNEKYEKFGKPGARLDDVLTFIPARLNFFFLLIATKFDKRVFNTMIKYGKMHPSPNSGISEAGFSGAIGISLNGPSYYGGKLKGKPWIGENRLNHDEIDDPALILKAITLYWKVISVTFISYLIILYLCKLPILRFF